MVSFRRLDSLTDSDLRGKRVLVREDLNVPLAVPAEGVGAGTPFITDDTRIRAALPTLRYLRDHGARVIVASHLGRPKGADPKLSLAPIAARLSELLGVAVRLAPDSVGPEVLGLASALSDGSVLLLENIRFHPEEEKNDPAFARQLAELADLYVNDAFGTAHRAHASTEGVAHCLPAVAGFLMSRELEALGQILEQPRRPFWAIIGGAKVSTKIGVIRHLGAKVDGLVIGGAMAFTFLKAQGHATGKSLVEADQIPVAREILADLERRGVPLLLPVDSVVAPSLDGPVAGVVGLDIPDDLIGVDIGPASIEAIRQALASARAILWNGPMGVFEHPDFAKGTLAVARMLSEYTRAGATTAVGGGDSVAALEQSGEAEHVTHVSTGGGASLEFLEGRVLPGVAALSQQEARRS